MIDHNKFPGLIVGITKFIPYNNISYQTQCQENVTPGLVVIIYGGITGLNTLSSIYFNQLLKLS